MNTVSCEYVSNNVTIQSWWLRARLRKNSRLVSKRRYFEWNMITVGWSYFTIDDLSNFLFHRVLMKEPVVLCDIGDRTWKSHVNLALLIWNWDFGYMNRSMKLFCFIQFIWNGFHWCFYPCMGTFGLKLGSRPIRVAMRLRPLIEVYHSKILFAYLHVRRRMNPTIDPIYRQNPIGIVVMNPSEKIYLIIFARITLWSQQSGQWQRYIGSRPVPTFESQHYRSIGHISWLRCHEDFIGV